MAHIYDKDYVHVKQIDKFFKYNSDKKEMVFTGKKLECIVPQRYEAYDQLEIGETAHTIAVCDLLIDDTYQAALIMLAKIEIAHREVSRKTIDGVPYFILTLYTGDRFICNTEVIKNSNVLYAIYSEFITKGHMPYFINYDMVPYLLDKAKEMCDTSLRVDHVILEIIYSHIARQTSDLSIQYRHTEDQSRNYSFIGLRNVPQSTTSTSARLLGSYFGDTVVSSLLTEVTDTSPLEQALR